MTRDRICSGLTFAVCLSPSERLFDWAAHVPFDRHCLLRPPAGPLLYRTVAGRSGAREAAPVVRLTLAETTLCDSHKGCRIARAFPRNKFRMRGPDIPGQRNVCQNAVAVALTLSSVPGSETEKSRWKWLYWCHTIARQDVDCAPQHQKNRRIEIGVAAVS